MKGIRIQEVEQEDFVYDIEVEDNHNFYVEDILLHNCFISVAPKMYLCRIFDNEGVKLTKPKLKVTGLSVVRSNTPKFFRKQLKHIMDLLVEKNIDGVLLLIKETRELMYKENPKDLSINVSVSNIDYTWDESKQRYVKWNGEKFLSCPINSRAAIKHNEYIMKYNVDKQIKAINQGEKISYIHLVEPNPAGTDIFAFKDSNVFEVNNLRQFIDYETMLEKSFISNIKLITDPLLWELVEEASKINEDDW